MNIKKQSFFKNFPLGNKTMSILLALLMVLAIPIALAQEETVEVGTKEQSGVETIETKTWDGVLRKCIPMNEGEEDYPGNCGKCYNYFLQDEEKGLKKLFNDEDFENLDKFVDKEVRITGSENEYVNIMCPKLIEAKSIELIYAVEELPSTMLPYTTVNEISEGLPSTEPNEEVTTEPTITDSTISEVEVMNMATEDN